MLDGLEVELLLAPSSTLSTGYLDAHLIKPIVWVYNGSKNSHLYN
jgi:hypothetical protein